MREVLQYIRRYAYLIQYKLDSYKHKKIILSATDKLITIANQTVIFTSLSINTTITIQQYYN